MTPDARQAIADHYFEEGSRLVDLATTYWDRAHDFSLDTAQRSGARLAYEQVSARARSSFKRHDLLLDAITRDEVSVQLTGPDLALRPDAACVGAADLCGAPAGQSCEPGCPSLATEEAGRAGDEPNWSTEQRETEEVHP